MAGLVPWTMPSSRIRRWLRHASVMITVALLVGGAGARTPSAAALRPESVPPSVVLAALDGPDSVRSVDIVPESATLGRGEAAGAVVDDFEGHPVGTGGERMSGWTPRWLPSGDDFAIADVTGPDGVRIRVVEGRFESSDYHLLSFDAADGFGADVDLRALVHVTSLDDIGVHVMTRAVGHIDDGTHGFVGLDLYEGDLRLHRTTNGSFNATTTPYSFSADSWHHMRLRVEGNLARAKAWPHGADEPGSWSVERDVSDHDAGDWSGVGGWDQNTGGYHHIATFRAMDLDGAAADGAEVQLEARVDAAEGASSAVTWSSSDPDVVAVDGAGLVTARGPGVAVVTATSVHDPTQSGSSTITVRDEEP